MHRFFQKSYSTLTLNITHINGILMCNNAPLGVVLAAISIKSKLILNNEWRRKSFT